MIRKYHNHKLQTTPWHREEEPLNNHETPGRQIKQSNQLSLPHQDDCNTKTDMHPQSEHGLMKYSIRIKSRMSWPISLLSNRFLIKSSRSSLFSDQK